MYRSFSKLENEATEILKKHPAAELNGEEVLQLLDRIQGNYFPNKLDDLFPILHEWYKIGMAEGYRMAQLDAKKKEQGA